MPFKRANPLTIVMTIAALFVVSLPALGHVGLEPSQVDAGEGRTLSFRIGHGCDGSATTSVSIQMPAGVVSVRPFPKAGWNLTIERGSLPEPIVTSGAPITEGVRVVTWEGVLEDAHTDVFQILATIHGDNGDHVYFPVVQQCETGEYAWIELPTAGVDSHDLESPAPGLMLVAPGGGHGEARDGGVDNVTLAIVALLVGGLGLIAGITSILRSRTPS